MTVTIEIPGYPDRLACELCGCQVGTLGRANWVAYDMASDTYALATGAGGLSQFAAGYRATDVDEPPIHCDIHDGCRCHESARVFLGNVYDGVERDE